MSEHWAPEPSTSDPPPRNWLCPEDGVALQNVRPSEDGWVGWCPKDGMQLGFQRSHSQEPENPPEEEPDD